MCATLDVMRAKHAAHRAKQIALAESDPEGDVDVPDKELSLDGDCDGCVNVSRLAAPTRRPRSAVPPSRTSTSPVDASTPTMLWAKQSRVAIRYSGWRC